MIHLIIAGDPIPAARPRFNKVCYQPSRNREYRREVETAAQILMRGRDPLRGALSVVVKLYRRYEPTSRNYGDVDNHLKALFDGMQGLIFKDDRQIVRCVVEKYQDKEKPRAEVFVTEV